MLSTISHLWWLWLIAFAVSGVWLMIGAAMFFANVLQAGRGGSKPELPGFWPAVFLLGASSALLVASMIVSVT